MTVRDQFAIDLRLAQREFEQASDATSSTPARARHAIESVRHTAHAVHEGRARLIVPGIAVATAHADLPRAESLDDLECSWQFGRQRDALDHVGVLQQSLRRLCGWILNEFLPLRAAPRSRNEGAFHMNASDLLDRRSTITNCVQYVNDRGDWRCRSCQQKRCRTAAGGVMGNRAKSFRRGLHRITAKRAVNVKIDKSRREIISTDIDDLIFRSRRLLSNLCNPPVSHDKLEAIANSVGENQTRVCKNHAAEH